MVLTYRYWMKWCITKTDYDKKLKELKDKQYDINIQLDEHTKADESYYITASTVFNMAKDALELFESSEVPEKRAILNYILSNYTVNEKTPCITMRSPFKELLSLTTQPMGLLYTTQSEPFSKQY